MNDNLAHTDDTGLGTLVYVMLAAAVQLLQSMNIDSAVFDHLVHIFGTLVIVVLAVAKFIIDLKKPHKS